MAAIQYKPTRMELSNLKKRLKTAVRGHKMMKDKRDELVRRFIVLARKNKELREQTEAKMAAAMQKTAQPGMIYACMLLCSEKCL